MVNKIYLENTKKVQILSTLHLQGLTYIQPENNNVYFMYKTTIILYKHR